MTPTDPPYAKQPGSRIPGGDVVLGPEADALAAVRAHRAQKALEPQYMEPLAPPQLEPNAIAQPMPNQAPAPGPPGALDPATTVKMDLVTGQQQASRPATARGMGLRQPEFTRAISTDEFYSGQERPANYRTSGGDQIWVPSSGRVPYGPLADRQLALQKRRQEYEEGVKKMFGGDEFKGKAAAPYERAYQSYVNQEQTRFVDDWANAYFGGDRGRAMKDIYQNPESNRQYQAAMRDLAAVGEVNKYKYDQYEKLYDSVLNNEAYASPDTMQSLEKFLSVDPFNSGQTAAQLQDGYRQLEHQVSRDKLWNDTYLPRIKAEMDTYQAEGTVKTIGGRKMLSETQVRSLDRLKEQAIREMSQRYGVGSEAEVRRFVEANLPQYSVTDLTPLGFPPSGGSSNQKRSGWSRGGFDTGTGIRAVPSIEPSTPGIVRGVKVGTPEVESIRLYRDVDGEQVDLKPQDYIASDGKPVFMKPVRLLKKKGEWFIEGTVYARPREGAVGGGGDQDVAAQIAALTGNAPAGGDSGSTEFTPLRTDTIPLSKNKEFITNYIDPDQVMREYRAGNTGAQAVGGPTQEEFDRMPSGTTFVGPDGVTYRKP